MAKKKKKIKTKGEKLKEKKLNEPGHYRIVADGDAYEMSEDFVYDDGKMGYRTMKEAISQAKMYMEETPATLTIVNVVARVEPEFDKKLTGINEYIL